VGAATHANLSFRLFPHRTRSAESSIDVLGPPGYAKDVGVSVTRYSPSRNYLWAGAAALGLALLSSWFVLHWIPAAIPLGLFVASAALLFFLACRPKIEIQENFLAIGSRRIPWAAIRKVDRTGWISPLVLNLALDNGRRLLVIYPGDLDSSNSLLRHVRRLSREALIDGVPYHEFWGEDEVDQTEKKPLPSPKYQLLRTEDEDEVERLYQRLKTVGHLDPKNQADEK
jgi:hypothetical protein